MIISPRMLRHSAVAALLVAAGILAAPATGHATPTDTAALHVGAAENLAEGQQITVHGTGFRPGLSAVAVGLCEQGYTNGLSDCDLAGGATFVNIAADGTFAELTLTARSKFGEIDCARQQCVIAAAPLPGTEPDAILTANSVAVPIGFAGTPFPAGAAEEQAPITANTVTDDVSGPSAVLWLATAALLLIVAVLALSRPEAVMKNQEDE